MFTYLNYKLYYRKLLSYNNSFEFIRQSSTKYNKKKYIKKKKTHNESPLKQQNFTNEWISSIEIIPILK